MAQVTETPLISSPYSLPSFGHYSYKPRYKWKAPQLSLSFSKDVSKPSVFNSSVTTGAVQHK